jgi:hypothetical protein
MLYDRKLYRPQDSVMKALVIYDDLALATEANAILQRATYHPNAAVHWNLRPWRLDMLEFRPTADEALTDAADAHLIVLAICRTPSLPAWLIDWLKQWAALRQTPDAALAVIGDGRSKATPAQATVEMSRFARQYGLTVICEKHGEINDQLASLDPNLMERKSPVFPASPDFGNAPNRGAYRNWGLNE